VNALKAEQDRAMRAFMAGVELRCPEPDGAALRAALAERFPPAAIAHAYWVRGLGLWTRAVQNEPKLSRFSMNSTAMVVVSIIL
jgi:hypothetical protein